jgi:CBS domain-containing protein
MYEFLNYRVCDAMTSDPVTIPPEMSLAEAEALFEERDFNAVPVVDDEQRLVGFFTKLDLLKAFGDIDGRMFTPYDEIMKKPVSNFMTAVPHVMSATPRTPLTKALQKLLELRSKSLPVVDDERVVGIVAREDILRALRRAVAGEKAQDPL